MTKSIRAESSVKDLEAIYMAHEARLPIFWVNGQGPIDADLVNFRENRVAEDAHSWFHFKEGFSRRLLPSLLTELGLPRGPDLRLLDPFAGVGTTLLSAQMAWSDGWRVSSVGVECNPFLRFATDAKLNWHRCDPARLRQLGHAVLSGGADKYVGALPEYSTLRNARVYHPLRLRCVLGYLGKIRRLAAGEPEEKLLVLGLASILEKTSGMRKDGRALRFVERKNGTTPREALRGKWMQMLGSLETMRAMHPRVNAAQVLEGDARDLKTLGRPMADEFDLIVYSPPYLNNIDYNEVYKIELWILGFVRSQEQFRDLKRSSLRSHPSANRPREDECTLPDSVAELIEGVHAALPREGCTRRTELFMRYALDMGRALRCQLEVLKPGGVCVCVVGNSLHGGRAGKVPVATDLIIASVAGSVGYDVNRMYVARHLRRRDREKSPFLRESVLVMAKPR